MVPRRIHSVEREINWLAHRDTIFSASSHTHKFIFAVMNIPYKICLWSISRSPIQAHSSFCHFLQVLFLFNCMYIVQVWCMCVNGFDYIFLQSPQYESVYICCTRICESAYTYAMHVCLCICMPSNAFFYFLSVPVCRVLGPKHM